MNIDNISLTNFKMSIAKTHITQLTQVSQLESPALNIRTGSLQSSYFSLYLGYLAFINEVSNHYNIENVISFCELKRCLDNKEIVCQHTELLADLEVDSQSWLGWLIVSYQQCLELKLPIVRKISEETAKLDNIIVSTSSIAMTEEAKFIKCFDKLQSVIKQFRQLMEEW